MLDQVGLLSCVVQLFDLPHRRFERFVPDGTTAQDLR
jgi:hypothetical protein